jgi:hypothetical protein
MAAAEPKLKNIHDFLVELAKKAGEMILAARPSAFATDSKQNCKFRISQGRS